MKRTSRPHLGKTYQMAQNGGLFCLPCSPGLKGEMLSKDQPIILLLCAPTHLELTRDPLSVSFYNPHMPPLWQHMGLKQEVGGEGGWA